jgi:membrane associated rhomboid family serine protease
LQQPRSARRPLPYATASIFLVTSLFMVAQAYQPEVLEALRRTPGALSDGEYWRLLTPMLVHSGGWLHYAVNAAALLVVGVLLERRAGTAWTLAVYAIAGVAGEIVGFAWRPHGAGASVGVFGLLGALVAVVSLRRGRGIRVASAIVIVSFAAGSIAARDVHGVPLLLGAMLGAYWFRSRNDTRVVSVAP